MKPLSWTEFIPDLGELRDFQHYETAGGGQILRRLYRGPDVPIRLAMTTDGVEWSELSLPYGFQLADIDSYADASVDLAGDRWVAFGHDVSIDPDWTVAEHVWFSDDQGSNWVKASVEAPPQPEPLPPCATDESEVLAALASNGVLVVVVRTSTRLDLDVLLADRGLAPAGKDLVNWVPSADGVTLTFADELPPEAGPPRRGRDRRRLQELETSYEDLRLSTRQLELLRRRRHTVTRIYSGEGPSLPFCAEYEGWVYKVTGVASAEGIVLATQGEWEALLKSADGCSWDEEPLGTVELWATGGDGARWALARTREGTRIDRVRHGDGRTTAAFLEAIENFGSFSAGPAGVVAAVLTGRSAAEPGLMPTKVRKAGRAYTQTGHGDYRAEEVWVGWSADGAEWGWQSASEAFGVDPGSKVSVELAVGEDFVLAEVSNYGIPWTAPERSVGFDPVPAAVSYAAAVPQRWFIARVG